MSFSTNNFFFKIQNDLAMQMIGGEKSLKATFQTDGAGKQIAGIAGVETVEWLQ